MACLFSSTLLTFANPAPALAEGDNGINVIIMIGDGMGWNMARAAAVAKGAPFYTSGKGSGLSFQNLTGYGLVTTYGTTIQSSTPANPSNQIHLTGNSALDNSNSLTGASPVRPGFTFMPTPFNPGTRLDGNTTNPGNLAGYDISQGGPAPWVPLTPASPGSYNREYIKWSYPDSANTATTLYTGVKSYNNALGVDIYERKLTTILEIAQQQGKATGLVTSVPVSHATPAAAASFVNRRSKYDSVYNPALSNQDSILQQTLLNFKPNVLLGGGHPLDFQNRTAVGPLYTYEYITQDTYEHLRNNPTPATNRYGYTFLERGPNATQTLVNTAANIDPNQGGRLFGLYGARGQNGNLPTSSSTGDYRTTGLDNFSLYSSVVITGSATLPCQSGQLIPGSINECVPQLDANGNPFVTDANGNRVALPSTSPFSLRNVNGALVSHPIRDTVRPLSPGETDASFIQREINENPTLADLTKAALTVLGKDRDGFWLMVEGGDIDWAAHDNNMDNLLGTMNEFDRAVQEVVNWINNNGGWSKNLLIVTADHDHYLTLNNDFASRLTPNANPNQARGLKYNAVDITYNRNNPREAGYFWGSDPQQKYLWGSHSRRLVPVYYQGAYSSTLTTLLGQPVQFTDTTGTTYSAPGVRGVVDQSHIFRTMRAALTSPAS
ncbi:alkaline phosphatase [Nostoc sp. FACHB-280]|nr:alkaline phosphatase [Nostoc sp. FACHB-280]